MCVWYIYIYIFFEKSMHIQIYIDFLINRDSKIVNM